MSTLNVSNITDGTDTVETGYVLNGSAKVLLNADGTGAIATRDTLNVSSIVDTATGSMTINYANNLANTDYINGGITNAWHSYVSNSGKTVSSSSLQAGISSHTLADVAQMNYIAFGDLA